MNNHDPLEEATSRLLAALEELEEAVAVRVGNGKDMEALEHRLQVVTAEREELAESLDAERRRADRLAAANDEVADRLDSVIDSVRSLVEAN